MARQQERPPGALVRHRRRLDHQEDRVRPWHQGARAQPARLVGVRRLRPDRLQARHREGQAAHRIRGRQDGHRRDLPVDRRLTDEDAHRDQPGQQRP